MVFNGAVNFGEHWGEADLAPQASVALGAQQQVHADRDALRKCRPDVARSCRVRFLSLFHTCVPLRLAGEGQLLSHLCDSPQEVEKCMV